MIISSKDNALIKKVSSLSDKKYRKLYGQFIVESVKAVSECIKANMDVDVIICTENLSKSFPDAQIVTDAVFSKISTEKSPQGVLAVVNIPNKELCAPVGDCLLLDRLQDPGNLGTIIRTANAAGYGDIYLVNCTDAYSPKAIRASMGGVFNVNLYEGSLEEVLGVLDGVQILSADMDGENVFSFIPKQRYCLCIGNEGNGLSDEVMARSDNTVKIPMRDSCESLNAAISAAIAMYALKNNQRR
ncbi:MAG: TrmH family RNA methyltransferase [Candidatus Coproplasma sp.]